MRAIFALAVVLALLAMTAPARLLAQNDQAGVLGFGLGLHRFSESDGFRNDNVNSGELDLAAMLQGFGEWYILGDFGIGFRLILMAGEEQAQTNADGSALFFPDTDRVIEAQTWLVTGHWIVAGGESYVRVGLLAGVGRTKYTERLEADCFFCGSNTKVIVSERSTSGMATLFSAYLDWGGDVFGARFGANFLRTDLDDLDGLQADASGVSLYFDFRWAFSRG